MSGSLRVSSSEEITQLNLPAHGGQKFLLNPRGVGGN